MEIRNKPKQFVLVNDGVVVAQDPVIQSDALDALAQHVADTAPLVLPPPPAPPIAGPGLGGSPWIVLGQGAPLPPPVALVFANAALRNDNEIVRAAMAIVAFVLNS